MALHKKLTLFLRKIQRLSSDISHITPEVLGEWQKELQSLLQTEVVNFSTEKIKKYFDIILRKNLTPLSYQKNFKNKSLNFTRANITATSNKYLDEHVLFSANLIKQHRDEQIQATLRRFSGWITSIPTEGEKTNIEAIGQVSKTMMKPLNSLKYENRRVLIDQGHKFTAAVNNAIAKDQGAIAVKWVSHWREAGYDYRPNHKDRDGHIFFLKENAFVKNGYIKKNGIKYLEDVDGFGQLPFCRCYGVYLFNLRDIPTEMLTEKGKNYING